MRAGERPAFLAGGERTSAADRLAARFDVWSAQRERREVHFLRYVPRTSPIHRLWAGTKFLAVGAISIALFVWPDWAPLAVLGGVHAGDGSWVPLRPASLCVHGDSPGALQMARAVRHALEDAGVVIAPFSEP